MKDEQIVDLYWERSESAIEESSKKYGRYCRCIAYNILQNEEDSEECVNDTWLRAWNAIPPKRPNRLSAFFGKITRNLSLNRYEKRTAEKRGGETELVLGELLEAVPSGDSTAETVDSLELSRLINRFVEALPAQQRKIFVRRYWYISPIKEIARDFDIGESKTKMILLRTRNELKEFLEKEGIEI